MNHVAHIQTGPKIDVDDKVDRLSYTVPNPQNGAYNLVAIVGTTILKPHHHHCQVSATNLKIGYPIFKWVALTWYNEWASHW